MSFVAADMPTVDRTTIQIYSVMAEFEARQISNRTKAALAQARARAVILSRAGLGTCANTSPRKRTKPELLASAYGVSSKVIAPAGLLSGRWSQNLNAIPGTPRG